MEPLKPEQKKSILANNPEAQPEDLEEYERLLAQRFTEDPDEESAASPVASGQPQSASQKREARIKELYQKLFKPAGAVATARR
jgi:hypothetical protein